MILVTEVLDKGWAYGKLQKDGASVGEEGTLQLKLVEFERTPAPAATAAPGKTKQPIQDGDIVKAIGAQEGTSSRLDFAKGAMILVTEVLDKGWAYGKLQKDGASVGEEGTLQLKLVEFERTPAPAATAAP